MAKIVKLITKPEHLEIEMLNLGFGKKLSEDIALFFSDIAELRQIVETDDYATLKTCDGIGDKRAKAICEALKGRFPTPNSNACPDIRKPDMEMMTVPERTLVFEDHCPKLSLDKYNHGKKVTDKNDNPIRNMTMKRPGPAIQFLQKLNNRKDRIVFTTVSEIVEDYKDPVKAFELQVYWNNTIRNGIKIANGKILMPDGTERPRLEDWVPGIMGTNARMKSQIHWIRLRDKAALRKWMECGANFKGKEVNIAKTEAYFGLLLPYTQELLGNVLNPYMETLVPGWTHEHEGKNMLISPNGDMVMKAVFNVEEFDGMCVVHITDELMEKLCHTRAEKRELKRLILKLKGGTIRAPYTKGVLIPWDKFHQALKDQGVTEWNGKPIEEIALWGDTSVFKASIGNDCLFEKFEDYAASFVELQHRFGLLLENHGVKDTFLPAQQLQAAHGGDSKFVEEGAEETVEYLKGALDPKEAAKRYEPGVIARIAQVDPSIMSTWFAKDMAANGYFKEYKHALSGRTYGNSFTGFVIKDLIAFVQWIAYLAGVRKELPTGCLGKYDVYAPGCTLKDKDGNIIQFTGEAVASRNPVIANYGLPVVNVVNTLGEYDKYFDEGFPFIMVGVHDDLCKLLRMDHDGDKIRLTFDKWFVNLVKSIKKPEAFAEWESFGEVEKAELNAENEMKYFQSCTMSPALGLNVDACGKMIAHGLFTKDEYEWLADYMMNKGTDVKQGADGRNVEGEAGKYWKEMNKANKENKIPIPMAYGKMMKGNAPKNEDVESELGNDNLSIINRKVRKDAPTELFYPGAFDINNVRYGKTNHVEHLVGRYFDKEAKEWKSGLFDEQCSRNKDVWSSLDERTKTTGYSEFLSWQKTQVMKEYKEFIKDTKYTMADVYDTITFYIFETLRKKYNQKPTGDTEEERKASAEQLKKNKAWYIVLARTYLQWFGDTMEEVYLTNNEMGFLPAVDQPVEFEEDMWE